MYMKAVDFTQIQTMGQPKLSLHLTLIQIHCVIKKLDATYTESGCVENLRFQTCIC